MNADRTRALPTDPEPSPAIGRGPLDDYHLGKEIGRGGTGIVYHAVRRSDRQEVAIKVLRPECQASDIVALRHYLESRYLRRISHPHIVTVHDAFIDLRTAAIVMEFIDGRSVRSFLARHSMAHPQAYRLLEQVASGLAAIHAHGLVHCDIKPENILVTTRAGDLHAVITDFGIAHNRYGPNFARGGEETASETGNVVGTKEYLAPELWSGATPTGAADCYALGVMAYEMLTGNRPFDGRNINDVRMAHHSSTAARPPELSVGAWEVLQACLAKSPDQRPDAAGLAMCFAELSLDATARPYKTEAMSPAKHLKSAIDNRSSIDSLAGASQRPETGDPAAATLGTHPERPSAPSDSLIKAADTLAEHVRRQWLNDAAARHLDIPAPIPVHWRWSTRSVTGPAEVALGNSPARDRFCTLPGTTAPTTATMRQGGLADLFTMYAALGSGRVVILGAPGSGKTGAAILTLLHALEHRRRLDDGRRAAVPVPVLLTSYGWDPRSQTLNDWFTHRMADTYPFLRSDLYGRDVAEKMVEDGRVALFLDGFDEMAPELQPVALQTIGRHARTFRLIILTRSDEFVTAVGSGHLHGAAALELCPVRPHDAAEYLRRCQVSPLPQQWRQLTDHLREQPHSILAEALDSPLNLTLLRDAFPNPADLDQLLDPDRIRCREDVENLLLDRILSVAYRPEAAVRNDSYSVGPAHRALGYLATQMSLSGTRDLAWWRMHRWCSPVPRVLAAGVLGVLIMSIVGGFAFGPAGQYTVNGATGTVFGVIYGASMGLVFGLLAGLVSEFRASRRAHFNLAFGSLVGLALTLAVGNQTHYVLGIPAGIVIGGMAGRAAARVRITVGQSRWTTLLSSFDRMVGLAAGLFVGMAYGFTNGLVNGAAAGLISFFTFGLMVGVARPVARTEVPTDPESSWRRDLRRGLSFGLSCALPLGLALGTANGMAHGPVAGFIAGIGFGLTIGIGGFVGISDCWRTSLMFLLLRRRGLFPVRGMSFLKDVQNRGILRPVGPLYQFRHARLQDRLADTHRT
jgi:serine/threonine protein kinase